MTLETIGKANELIERKTWAEDILESMEEKRKLTLRFSFGRESSSFAVPEDLRKVIEDKVREMKEEAEMELEGL